MMITMPSFVSHRKVKSNHDQALINSDLLEVLVGSLLLDLDKVIVIIILGLGNLSFALTLGSGSLGLLGGSGNFLVIGAVVIGRQDDRRRALLGRLGTRGLCSSRALDDGVVLSVHLLLESGPGVAGRADGEASALGKL